MRTVDWSECSRRPTGTVALSDRPTRVAPAARPEAIREAFRCPVYGGFASAPVGLASLLGAQLGHSSPQCNSALRGGQCPGEEAPSRATISPRGHKHVDDLPELVDRPVDVAPPTG